LIVFLDFDGVLHSDPCPDPARLFEHAPRLAQALRHFPAAALVLSTTWRQKHPYQALLGMLPPLLQRRTLGVTPTFGNFTPAAGLAPYRRQAECVHWLHSNRLPNSPWIALDDRPSGFAPYCDNLIACHPRSGFDATASARLRSALQRHAQRAAGAVDLPLD